MDQGGIVADGEPNIVLDGPVVPAVFGIVRVDGRWRPVASG